MKYKQLLSQLDLYEKGRRSVANFNEGASFLLKEENLPTLEELTVLRLKNPKLWNKFKHPSETIKN
jgi:hypothetical protein